MSQMNGKVYEVTDQNRDGIEQQWHQYLELLAEHRDPEWLKIAKSEGPPFFDVGTKATVHGRKHQVMCRISNFNTNSGKLILRPLLDERDLRDFNEGEIVIFMGIEWRVKEAKKTKLALLQEPVEQTTKAELMNVVVNNGETGRPFLALLGETEGELTANTNMMHRVFQVVRDVAKSDCQLDTETVDDATALVLTLGLDKEPEGEDEPPAEQPEGEPQEGTGQTPAE